MAAGTPCPLIANWNALFVTISLTWKYVKCRNKFGTSVYEKCMCLCRYSKATGSWNIQADRMVGGTANKLQHQLSAASRTVFCRWHSLSFTAPFTEFLCLNYCTAQPIPRPHTLPHCSPTLSLIFSTLTGSPGLCPSLFSSSSSPSFLVTSLLKMRW